MAAARETLTSSLVNNSEECLLFTAQDHSLKILQNFRQLQQSATLCDVQITVAPRSFVAHRSLLSASSPYFKAMFSGGMSEGHNDRIVIHSLSASTFSTLLDFVYTGKIELNRDNVQDLLAASDMLQLNDVLMACSTFLKRELQPDNCIGIYRLAEAHLSQTLVDAAASFIHTNFIEISRCEEFYDLPITPLKTILQSENLKVDNELQVFDAAMRWIMHDVTRRRRHVYEIMSFVRILLISYRDLDSVVAGLKDLSLKVALTKLLQDYKQEMRRSSLEARLFQSTKSKLQPRKWAQKSLYTVGGFKRDLGQRWSDGCTLADVQRFNTYESKWQAVTSLKEPRSGHALAISNELLFVIGGENQGLIFPDVDVYSIVADCWVPVPALLTPRCQMGACTIDGYVFIFGGCIDSGVTNTIERYDPMRRQWEPAGLMTSGRYAMGAIVHQGLMYVVGGRCYLDGDLATTERYDPVKEEWTKLADLRIKRSFVGVTILDNFLYVVGGCSDSKELNSVERYDFEKDRWENVAPMTVCRAGASVASINGILYVVGGHTSAELSPSVTLKTVECYYPATDTWKPGVPMSIGCSEAGVAVF